MDSFESFELLSMEIETSKGTALLMADPHIGFEISRGLRIRTHFEERLAEFVLAKDPDLLIILGDVKEPLGISFSLKRLLMGFFSELRQTRVVITKGNHDGQIEKIAEKFPNVEVVDHMLLDDRLFLHGHTKLPDVAFKEAFLGHIHPSHTFEFKGALRRSKVFLRVDNFLVLPTINPFIEGLEIREGFKMVPFFREKTLGEVFLPHGVYLGKVPLRV